MKNIIFCIIFSLVASSFSQDAKINIERDTYELGDDIKVSFELNYNKKYDSIVMPDLSNFKIQSQSKSSAFLANKNPKMREERF